MENQPPIPRTWFRQLAQLRNEPTPQLAPSPQQAPPSQPTPTQPTRRLTFAQPRPPVATPTAQPELQSPQPQPQPEPQPQLQSPQPQPVQPRPPTPSLPTLEPQLTTPSLSPPPPPPPQPRPLNTPETKLSTPTRSLVLPPQTQPQPSQRLRDPPSPPSPPPSPNRQYSNPLNRTSLDSPKAKELQPLVPPQPKSIIVQEASNNGEMNGQSSQASAIAPPNYKRADKDAPSDGEVSMKSKAQKKKDDSEMSVITIAGENMGAYMELGYAHHHENNKTRKHPDQHLHNQGYDNELTGDEGKSKDKEKATKPPSKTKPIASLVNSNVQSVNNSILFNTSCTTRSPGVHLTLASHHAIRATVPHSKGEVKLSKEPQVANHDH